MLGPRSVLYLYVNMAPGQHRQGGGKEGRSLSPHLIHPHTPLASSPLLSSLLPSSPLYICNPPRLLISFQMFTCVDQIYLF